MNYLEICCRVSYIFWAEKLTVDFHEGKLITCFMHCLTFGGNKVAVVAWMTTGAM